jgi:hypothetical protein
MSAGMYVKHVAVTSRDKLPSPMEVGTLYFIMDESRIIIDHGNDVVEYAGTANAVVDSVSGGETQKAPSVRAVSVVMDGKADILNGKILQSQLPPSLTLYRGVFASDAALSAAFPTDVNGAFATVTATGSMWYFDGIEWVNTGSLGASAIQSLNGLVGPDVTVSFEHIGPANVSAALMNNSTLSEDNPVAAKGDIPVAATAEEAKSGANEEKFITSATLKVVTDEMSNEMFATIKVGNVIL